jgi:hypothetical protein
MKAKVGQKVICNGYPGAIKEVCAGQLEGLVVVALDRGTVCVSQSELRFLPDKPAKPIAVEDCSC